MDIPGRLGPLHPRASGPDAPSPLHNGVRCPGGSRRPNARRVDPAAYPGGAGHL